MNYVKLNNGIEMPQLGFGTYLIPDENLEDALINANGFQTCAIFIAVNW